MSGLSYQQASWVEELLGDTTSGDYRGVGTRQRVFIVQGVEAAQIIQAPETVVDPNNGPLPAYNSAYQPLPGLTLDSYDVQTVTRSTQNTRVVRATARYSNNRQFRLPPKVDRLDPAGEAKEGWARVELRWTIPFAQQKRSTFDNGTPTPGERLIWVEKTRTHLVKAWRRSVTVTVSNLSQQARAQIDAQTDRLHRFPGYPLDAWFLFEVGNIRKLDDRTTLWEIEYLWTRDKGTEEFSNSTATERTLFPPKQWTAGTSTKYVRPPWHELLFEPHPTDPTEEPEFTVFSQYVSDPSGWQGLPGLSP